MPTEKYYKSLRNYTASAQEREKRENLKLILVFKKNLECSTKLLIM